MKCGTGLAVNLHVGVCECGDVGQVGVTYKQGPLPHLQRPILQFPVCSFVCVWFWAPWGGQSRRRDPVRLESG